VRAYVVKIQARARTIQRIRARFQNDFATAQSCIVEAHDSAFTVQRCTRTVEGCETTIERSIATLQGIFVKVQGSIVKVQTICVKVEQPIDSVQVCGEGT
jgi:hypothetical protein